MHIEILDPVWSRLLPKEEIDQILPCLAYENEFWKPGPFRKEQKKEEAYMIHRGSGKFLTGLIPRIEKYCQTKGYELSIPCLGEKLEPEGKPYLPGITLRDDQIKMIEAVCEKQRGIIKSATGTGKTLLAGATCSVWPNKKILFLTHTLDLLQQTTKVFSEKFQFENVISLGGGKNKFDWPEEPTIVVSTIQTYSKLNLEDHYDYWDIIIIDEAHHAAKKGLFTKALERSLAPIRIGLTATPPTEKEKKELLTLEGYLGKIIGDFSFSEGIKAGILSRPLINLIEVPWSDSIGGLHGYKDIFQKGIVENRARNRLVLDETNKSILKGESVLILTATNVEHGHILKEMAKDLYDLDIPFVYGATEKETRQEIQEALSSKTIKAVLANVIWKEGVNIPSVNHIINAAGGLKERTTLQKIGRGSRAIGDKKTVQITDFLDLYKGLDHHCIMRLAVYSHEGWLRYD